MLKPVLYLTSEIHNRDWDTRLLMADFATAQGFSVVVGQQWSPHENFLVLPRGLLLAKTLNQIQADTMIKYRKRGHLVAAMDEEFFAVAPDQGFPGWVSKDIATCCDLFFANSPLHADLLVAIYPDLKPRMIPVGNPRMDLLSAKGRARYRREADAIRQRIGPFVLFNSNMAQGNSIFETKEEYMDVQVRAGSIDPNDAQSIDLFNARFDFEAANNAALIATIQWCVEALPGHAVVIRPHPAEKGEFWQNFAAGNPRMTIAAGTHHVPWMMASDIVVHTNSTTGMEAAMLGKPSVNLMPQKDGLWPNLYISSRVNPTFHDWRDATAAIHAFIAHGQGPLASFPEGERALDRYFPHRGQYLVAERMVTHMIALMKKHGVDRKPFSFFNSVVGKYKLFQRDAFKLHKFQKTLPQAMADFNDVRQVSKLTHRVQMSQLDESAFVLNP